MNRLFKSFFLFTCMLIMCGSGLSQQAINAAGGNAMGSGGSASYSVGQVYFTTIGQNGITVAQGVQQAAQVQAIPTMSDWGFMVLMLILIIIGVQSLKVMAGRNRLSPSILFAVKKR